MEHIPESEISDEFPPFFRVLKDGRVKRYWEADYVPPSDNSAAGVKSKDVVLSPENDVKARIFLPKSANPSEKLPLLIYIHGGGFSLGSAFSAGYHDYVESLAAESNMVAVSVEYRLAPEHPLPACYDDSWAAIKWVASQGPDNDDGDDWIKNYSDLTRVFLTGDSAGANIASDMVVRASTSDELEDKVRIVGLALVHPFFGNHEPNKYWEYIFPETSGLHDPKLNPAVHHGLLCRFVCKKILVLTAEKDELRDRGRNYYEALKKSGWEGELEFEETEEEDHVFHLFNPTSEKSKDLKKRLVCFFKS